MKDSSSLVVINPETHKVTTSSLKVAEVFGKQHAHVMRDIMTLETTREFDVSNFGWTTYRDTCNREQRMVELTRDGFTILVMGYTGKKAMEFKEKYIQAFNDMERQLYQQPTFQIPQTLAEALILAGQQMQLLEVAQPKIEAFDALMESTGLLSFSAVSIGSRGVR